MLFGRSNNFILALNLKADLPGHSPISQVLKPYFDIGYYDNAQPTGQSDAFKDQLLWNGGLSLDLFSGMLRIYFPIIYSENLKNHVKERGDYFTRISFFFNWEKAKPMDWLYALD